MKLSDVIKMEGCGCFPTPIHPLENLSQELGCALYIKRDDLTGLGFSGNKIRKLQYLVADAKAKGCTTLLTYGGVQTNHGRQTAAVANRFHMKSILIATLETGVPPEKLSGNLLLDAILGCDIRFLDTSALHDKRRGLTPDEIRAETAALRAEAAKQIAAEYEAKGEKVYIMPAGGSTPIGCLGYFYAVEEMMQQLRDQNIHIDYVCCASGSSSTYAGLYLGIEYFHAPFRVLGTCVSPHGPAYLDSMERLINETSDFFELGIRADREKLRLLCNECAGPAYDVPDSVTFQTIYRLAHSEGLFVDPCYTGKGLTGLLYMIEHGIIPGGKSVLFIHTGGLPGLYSSQHLEVFSRELWERQEHKILRAST